MSEENDVFRANDAQALLDNELFKAAFKAVGEYVESRALSCDPDKPEMAQRIVITKQILAAVEREIRAVVETGEVAKIRIAEIEKKKHLALFRR